MPNEVPDVPKSRRKPGDLILDRVMPDATDEEREAARENLRQFAEVIIGIAKRLAREETVRESEFESPRGSSGSK